MHNLTQRQIEILRAIIEEYINSVHFVSNPTGQSSMVRNISKEVYLKEKEEHFSKLLNLQ